MEEEARGNLPLYQFKKFGSVEKTIFSADKKLSLISAKDVIESDELCDRHSRTTELRANILSAEKIVFSTEPNFLNW